MYTGAIGLIMIVVLLFVIVVVLIQSARDPPTPVRIAAHEAYQRALAYASQGRWVAHQPCAIIGLGW